MEPGANVSDVARRNDILPQQLYAWRRAAKERMEIDAIFDIERAINGHPAEERLAVRQELARPLVTELEAWMRETHAQLSRHDPVAKAINYMLKVWPDFARFLVCPSWCIRTTTSVC